MDAAPTTTSHRRPSHRRAKHDGASGGAPRPTTDSAFVAAELRAMLVPIGNLTLHPRNARRGNIEAIIDSLRRFGQLKPVVVQQSTGYVVAGNHLLRAALALGWQQLAANVVELDDATAQGFMLADNRTADLGTYDEALLAAILEEQASAGNLAGTGYTSDDVDELLARLLAEAERPGDPDAVPEPPADADVYVQPGELWLLGRHRLLVGDSTNPDDVARLLAGAEPTLLSVDPPFGISLDGSWRDRVTRRSGARSKAPHARTSDHRNTTLAGDTRVDWSEAFALVPSLQVGYVWHAALHAAEVAAGLERIGFEIVSQIIWDKGLFALGHAWYHWAHEPCWVVRKRGFKVGFWGERNQATVWHAPSPKMVASGSTETKLDHPAQKPVLLSEIPIANHLRGSDAVYDPFAGSGTTIIAAERLGRRCYALEIDPKFAQIAIERFQTWSGQTATREVPA